jgi:hypothetical protein
MTTESRCRRCKVSYAASRSACRPPTWGPCPAARHRHDAYDADLVSPGEITQYDTSRGLMVVERHLGHALFAPSSPSSADRESSLRPTCLPRPCSSRARDAPWEPIRTGWMSAPPGPTRSVNATAPNLERCQMCTANRRQYSIQGEKDHEALSEQLRIYVAPKQAEDMRRRATLLARSPESHYPQGTDAATRTAEIKAATASTKASSRALGTPRPSGMSTVSAPTWAPSKQEAEIRPSRRRSSLRITQRARSTLPWRLLTTRSGRCSTQSPLVRTPTPPQQAPSHRSPVRGRTNRAPPHRNAALTSPLKAWWATTNVKMRLMHEANAESSDMRHR